MDPDGEDDVTDDASPIDAEAVAEDVKVLQPIHIRGLRTGRGRHMKRRRARTGNTEYSKGPSGRFKK